MNYTCNVWVNSFNTTEAFYLLNHACASKQFHATTICYALLGGLLMILAGIVYFSFNSVRVLRYEYSIPVISNNVWAIYFVVASIRSIVLAIAYSQNYHSDHYILSNWIIGSFEIMALALALKYQLRFRSQEDDITASVEDNRNQFIRYIQAFKLQEILILSVFGLIVIWIILFKYNTSRSIVWFWVYVAFTILLLLIALAFAIRIATKSGYHQPSRLAKLLILIAVLLCIPERIPIFVWKYCMGGETCLNNPNGVFDAFDLFLVLKMISAVLIFVVSIREYYRYQEEAQFVILREFQGYIYSPRESDNIRSSAGGR